MSKPSNTWALRFKNPQDFPNVIKFSDELNWDQGVPPISAYFKEEELKEDDMPVIEHDSLYYRRKRERRRHYRSKKTLVMEDSTVSGPANSSSGFRFEGKLCNLGLADTEEAKVNSAPANAPESPFRYVMLQFVKGKLSNGEPTNEINVIPVGDMFALKKSVRVEDELLADIDSRFMDEVQRSKGNISRYKGINKSLTTAERMRIGLHSEEGAGNNTEGLNSKEFLGGFGTSSVFGTAANKAISSNISGTKRSATASGTTYGTSHRSMLNENGVDEDELRVEDYRQDYSVKFADDEEEYVTTEQSSNHLAADRELSAAHRNFADGDDGSDSQGDSTDEDDEEERTRGKDSQSEARGMVDDRMISGAAQARLLFTSKPSSSSSSSSSSAAAAVVGTKSTAEGGY